MGSLNDTSKKIRDSVNRQALRFHRFRRCPDQSPNTVNTVLDQEIGDWDPEWRQSRIAPPNEFCIYLESYHGHVEQNR